MACAFLLAIISACVMVEHGKGFFCLLPFKTCRAHTCMAPGNALGTILHTNKATFRSELNRHQSKELLLFILFIF